MEKGKIKIYGSDGSYLTSECDVLSFGDSVEVRYDELAESGFGDTKTTITASLDKLTIKRLGEVSMEMVLSNGGISDFPLDAAEGSFYGRVVTSSYTFSVEEKTAEISAQYDLSFGEGHTEARNIKIQIERVPV